MEKMLLNPLNAGFSLINKPENNKIATIDRFLEYYKQPKTNIEITENIIRKTRVLV